MSLSLKRFSMLHHYLRILKYSSHGSLASTFLPALKKDYPLTTYINIGTQYKSRCYFSGYSRGLRFNMSRLQLLKLSYRGTVGSFFGGR